jgi:DNA-binding transcriptional ArsR family regulator
VFHQFQKVIRERAGLGSAAWRAEQPVLDEIFGALSNETRRTILVILHAHGGYMTSGEFVDYFEWSWPNISRHLKVLEVAGLVEYETRGRDHAYKLVRAPLENVAGPWIQRFAASRPPAS